MNQKIDINEYVNLKNEFLEVSKKLNYATEFDIGYDKRGSLIRIIKKKQDRYVIVSDSGKSFFDMKTGLFVFNPPNWDNADFLFDLNLAFDLSNRIIKS